MKLCLIGSTRFMDQYRDMNHKLTLAGHIVYSVAAISTSVGPNSELPEDQKMVLDLVHLRKIQESDAIVLVTDETCYYGFSTKREILWAQMLNKGLYGPEKLSDDFVSPWLHMHHLFEPLIVGR